MRQATNQTKAKTMNHTNLASGYRYHGGNALILTQACTAHGWKAGGWATATQAARLGRPVLPGQSGVTVSLNEKAFTVFNAAQLAEKPQTVEEVALEEAYEERREAEYEERKGHLDGPATGSAKPLTKAARYSAFRDQLPNRATGWPREARAFFDGLPNGGRYEAMMGQERGEFIYAAMKALAETGDADGRRYTLQLEQVGWAVYTNVNLNTGKALKRTELVARMGMVLDDVTTATLATYQERAMAHPIYRMTLTPAAAPRLAA